MHGLLLLRLPRGAKAPPLPEPPPPTPPPVAPVPEETESAGPALVRNPRSTARCRRRPGPGPYAAVRGCSPDTRGLSAGYAAVLRGEAAQILFTQNRDDEAYDIAAAGVHPCRPAGRASMPPWPPTWPASPPGAWTAPTSPRADVRGGLAGRDHDPRAEGRRRVLGGARASAHRRPGRRRALDGSGGGKSAAPSTACWRGARSACNFGVVAGQRETLGEADIDAVAATPAGLRAFALLQVGQPERAEAELRRLWPAAQCNPALGPRLMLVASKAGLADLAAQFADLVQPPTGGRATACASPVPRLRPAGGFTVDPAMVYGLARTESNFDAGLVSPAGARGLMQIMPETARFIVQPPALAWSARLHDPAVNLDLGQRYVAYLATHDAVGGDLIRLLASYNAGPGNFARWASNVRDVGDPLLFIEAIPVDETRGFVPRVLTYTWIYAARLHLPTPSLDELAAGVWPRYHAMEMRPRIRRTSERVGRIALTKRSAGHGAHRRKPPLHRGQHRRAHGVRYAHRANDTSGDALAGRIAAAGHRVAARAIERDDADAIEKFCRAGSPIPASTW